jgi:baseplate J-like protein
MPQSFTLPSSTQILQSLLQVYQGITALQGYSVRTDTSSDVYLRSFGQAQQLAILYSLAKTLVDARCADTATGSDLDRVLNQFGLSRKPATSSEGFFQIYCSAPVTLTSGMLLSAVSNGLTYQVSQSGIFSNGQSVPFSSVDQGEDTDIGAGETLQWINLPPLTQQTALVSVAATGGSDAETDAEARIRLYALFQNPAGSGNASMLINISQNVDPLIQSAFVYGNFQGAGTQLLTLIGYQSDGYYIGRDIPHLTSDNVLNFGSSPYNTLSQNYGSNLANDSSAIQGQLPVGVSNPYATVISTVNNVACDVSFALNLPYPVGNPNNGYGGGWLNYQGYTWPNPDPDGYVVGRCKVISVASSTNITISAVSSAYLNTGSNQGSGVCAPTAGQTKIAWIDRSGGTGQGWLSVTATVLSATDNGNNTWAVSLDTPLVTSGPYDFYGNSMVSVGDYISPAAVNLQNYVNTIMGSFAILGPGQATNVQENISIGAGRNPGLNQAYPAAVSGLFTQSITSQNPEVEGAIKLYEFHTDGSASGNPPTAASPPGVLIPRQLSIYDSNVIQ